MRQQNRCEQMYRAAEQAAERADNSGNKSHVNRAKTLIENYKTECR